LVLVFFIILAQNIVHDQFQIEKSKLKKTLQLHIVFLLVLGLDFVLIKIEKHEHIFELILAAFSLFLLGRIAAIFYQAPKLAWKHPTTFGNHYVSAGLQGLGILLSFNIAAFNKPFIPVLLFVLIILDLSILFARFKYLSKANAITHRIAQRLMGKNILYYGLRIIIGIFMPMVYVVYMFIVKINVLQGVAFFIMSGMILERYLFMLIVDDEL
jgi:hypothetical protein